MPGEGRDVAPTHGGGLVVEGREDSDIRRDGRNRRCADECHWSVRMPVPIPDGREAAELASVGIAPDRDGQYAEPLGRAGFIAATVVEGSR